MPLDSQHSSGDDGILRHPDFFSVYDCIWRSNTPLKSLQDLGGWLIAQPWDSANTLTQLVEIANLTHHPRLISTAKDCLYRNPITEPWLSLFNLKILQAESASITKLRQIAQRLLLNSDLDNLLLDESSWRLVAGVLLCEPDLELQERLQGFLSARAPLEKALVLNSLPLKQILEAHPNLQAYARHASAVYASAAPSIRRPYAFWADPSAVSPAALDQLIHRLIVARTTQQGFSLVRLGDGEGLFLSGKRPDLGGATINGTRIAPHLASQGYCLEGREHDQLLRRFGDAIANADWIGIPDLHQCLSGPVNYINVASGLQKSLLPEQWSRAGANLVVGGCHIHNALLQAGCFSRPPFNDVTALIAPSKPSGLQHNKNLLWLRIPGEARLRSDAFGVDAHYPVVFEQTLAAIDEQINPGDLVIIGAGILGKIYCEAVRQRRGIAVDVGSVIDLCSGHGSTRGEYRLHPWLQNLAEQAFWPADWP